MKKCVALLLALIFCRGAASAQTYVSITQLQKQGAEGWDRGQEMLAPV